MLTLSSARMNFARLFSTSTVRMLKRIKETTQGQITTVELEDLPESTNVQIFRPRMEQAPLSSSNETETDPVCSCVLCKIPVKISYKDVLILEQYMREDGTVLPMELTGLCQKQQQRLERCVMQAHWSGLFPDRTIPEFDRAGYKRFNRHWDDDLAMFRLKFKMEPGSWFYIKRYNPKIRDYRPYKKVENEGKLRD